MVKKGRPIKAMEHFGGLKADIVSVKVHEHLKSQRQRLSGISPI